MIIIIKVRAERKDSREKQRDIPFSRDCIRVKRFQTTFYCARSRKTTAAVQYFSNRFQPFSNRIVPNAKRANIGVIENADFAPDKRVNDP